MTGKAVAVDSSGRAVYGLYLRVASLLGFWVRILLSVEDTACYRIQAELSSRGSYRVGVSLSEIKRNSNSIHQQ
jgi:hypothetical protein